MTTDNEEARITVGENILLTLWVGAIWAIGYIAAPTLFAMLDDRALAGVLAGRLFSIVSYLGLVCGGLLLIGQILHGTAGWRRNWRLWLIVAMLGLVATGF